METTRNNLERCQLPIKGKNGIAVWDKVCIWILALCPILQHYKAIFDNAGTMAMILAFFCFGINLLKKKQWRVGAVLPLIVASIYEIINHGTGIMEIAREALLIAYFVAAASGAINLRYFLKVATCIAMAASALVAVQYVCYYIFGFHLQLAAAALLDSSAEQWVQLVQTGRISVTGNMMRFYRPSAFFLEPSHITLYSFPALVSVMFGTELSRKNIAPAILLSLGIVLSTSGMGIALVFGCWGLVVLKRLMGEGGLRDQFKRLIQPKSLIWIGAIVAFFLLLFICVKPFRMSVIRIFYSPDGTNAISGRMSTGILAVSDLSGIELWFGKQNWGSVHNWNMAGFFYTFYTQGLIGVLLSYGFYVFSLWKTKHAGFWIAFIVIGLSFVTIHTHAAFYMLYYVLFLLGNYDLRADKVRIHNVLFSIWCRAENWFLQLWKARKQEELIEDQTDPQ